MKHEHAELIGTPVAPELLEDLNSRLNNVRVTHLNAIRVGDLEKEFSIHMEGILEGHEFTPFGVSANGKENHAHTAHLTNDKGTTKLFKTYEDRVALNQFFIEKVVPLFC